MKTPRKAAKRSSAAARKPKRPGAIALPSDSLAQHAPDLKAQLTSALSMKSAITIDIGAVKRIDFANLQLLVAFVRDRRVSGRPIAWKGTSQPFSHAVGALGLATALGV